VEITMTAHAKLTETQTIIMNAAACRPDGNIEPLSATLRGGARAKVIEALTARGLIVDAAGQFLLTDAGYSAIGKRRPIPKGVQNADTHDALQKLDPIRVAIRTGTKLAAIIEAMRQPDGATITQMMSITGWQAHTVRGAISGTIKKKLGHAVVAAKSPSADRTYRIT
jgi:hypothetical protein